MVHSKRYTQKYNPKEQLRYARKNQCLFICGEKHDYINLVQTSSQLGTFHVEYDCGLYQKILSSLISSYSKVTHVHYGRHVTDCSWLSSASLNICTLVNSYDAECLVHRSTALSTEAVKSQIMNWSSAHVPLLGMRTT